MMKRKFKMIGNARPIPVWMWFFALFAISSFVGLLMYLDMYEKGRVSKHSTPDISSLFATDENSAEEDKKPQVTAKKASPPEEKSPSFDFYSLLPKMEVLVPETEITSRIAKEQLKPEPGDKGAFFLQAGAFKDIQAADRMKAGLALLGVESRIESVTLDSGVWHRVRVGPFNDTQQLNKVRSLMKANNISSIMVKVNS
ncbi:MAG: SPOR domain-containing protein [Gammaproteobacteria bacterium]|nr:SPOR domain-containing protein [Gammaproteobacteria bacterium]